MFTLHINLRDGNLTCLHIQNHDDGQNIICWLKAEPSWRSSQSAKRASGTSRWRVGCVSRFKSWVFEAVDSPRPRHNIFVYFTGTFWYSSSFSLVSFSLGIQPSVQTAYFYTRSGDGLPNAEQVIQQRRSALMSHWGVERGTAGPVQEEGEHFFF